MNDINTIILIVLIFISMMFSLHIYNTLSDETLEIMEENENKTYLVSNT